MLVDLFEEVQVENLCIIIHSAQLREYTSHLRLVTLSSKLLTGEVTVLLVEEGMPSPHIKLHKSGCALF